MYERALLHNTQRMDVMVTMAMRNRSKAPSRREITTFSSLPRIKLLSHKLRPEKEVMQAEAEEFCFDFPTRPPNDPVRPLTKEPERPVSPVMGKEASP